MKALIRKNPDTPTKPAQDEVYLEPWLDWIDPVTGSPLTGEGYTYALCTNVPDEPVIDPESENDLRLDVSRYIVSSEEIEEEGEDGEIKKRTVYHAVWGVQ